LNTLGIIYDISFYLYDISFYYGAGAGIQQIHSDFVEEFFMGCFDVPASYHP
jgi:hypothetical protein